MLVLSPLKGKAEGKLTVGGSGWLSFCLGEKEVTSVGKPVWLRVAWHISLQNTLSDASPIMRVILEGHCTTLGNWGRKIRRQAGDEYDGTKYDKVCGEMDQVLKCPDESDKEEQVWEVKRTNFKA